jgi:hypothetical protein
MNTTAKTGETTGETTGPALETTVQEVQGHFATDAALQKALGSLTLAGFDRADLSLPNDQAAMQTPSEGAENPVDHVDRTQLRTMGTSMAGYAGAATVAAATIATGGAAGLAVAAAAAVGAGAALTAHAAGRAAETASEEARDEKGRQGRLILAVRTSTADEAARAIQLMQDAGAASVETINRGADMLTAGVSAASWTGA